MIPVAKITKLDGQTGTVKPSSKGICAIIAPSSIGTANQPAAYTKAGLALTDYGYGALTDDGAYIMAVSGNPVVLVKGAASTAATTGTVTTAGTGTGLAASTAAGSTPFDDFNVLVTITTGGTRGVAGIYFTYSLDGGLLTSAPQALGTGSTATLPNSGVVIAFGTGTFVAGDTISFSCTGPRMTTSDISTALEALRVSQLPYEFILVAGHDATSTTVTTLDTWLQAREAEGRFKFFLVNAAAKGVTSEAAYLTAMTTAWAGVTSIRGCVGADVGDLVSAVPGRGVTQQRPSSLALAARVAKIAYGTDPAYVADGPLTGFGLPDTRGNPKNHDENMYPGLDALRLVSLRSFDSKAGTYITNANVISAQGSDYVWVQHLRVMNRACEIAYATLTNILSRRIAKSPKLGPNGEVYIAEEDAQRIDALVNQALSELRSQVSDLRFTLSRTDNIGANGPVVLNGNLQVSASAYAKEIDTNASFARTITVGQ